MLIQSVPWDEYSGEPGTDYWMYLEVHGLSYSSNLADDLTRGKTLTELSIPNKWSQGSSYLLRPNLEWLFTPPIQAPMDKAEQLKGIFCGILTETTAPNIPEFANYTFWIELREAMVQIHKGAEQPSAADYQAVEMLILQKSQIDSFPEEYRLLKAKRPIHSTSQLLTLAPEYDESCQVIRVGGHLHHAEGLESSLIHPIHLDPHHTATKLLIKDYDIVFRKVVVQHLRCCSDRKVVSTHPSTANLPLLGP